MIYRIIITAIFLGLGSIIATSQTYIDNKQIIKQFAVTPKTVVDISNKYGKVHVLSSNSDSLKLGIDVTAQGNDEDEVEGILDNINFDINQTPNYVTVKTVFQSNKPGIMGELSKMVNTIIPSANQVKVNFIVAIPSSVYLKIDNKYGDVLIDTDVTNMQLSLSNGNFKAHNLLEKSDLNMKFCDNIDINSIDKGTVSIHYADDFEVAEINELNLTSKSSTIRIDKIKSLRLDSKSDKIYIIEIDKLSGESYFTDHWLYLVNDEINYQTKYGKLNLEEISKGFSFINIDSKLTDLNLTFQGGSSYNIDITHKINKLTYPISISDLKQQKLEDDDKKILTYGKIGKSSPTGKVKVVAENSSVNIQHK